MNIVLLGPPGVGKGTQANRLEASIGVPHIASGDIFRDAARESTPGAEEIRTFMDRGDYVPDTLTIDVILRRLGELDAAGGFVLDGFPRTRGQAEALDNMLASRGKAVDVALSITAPVQVLTKRLSGRFVCPQCHTVYNMDTRPPAFDMMCDVCGHALRRRDDEAPDVIKRRLDTFFAQTQPVVDYYRRQCKLMEVNGALAPTQVSAVIDAALANIQPGEE